MGVVVIESRERRTARQSDKLLDRFLPAYHFNEVHATIVRAAPDEVFAAIRALRADEIRWLRELMWLRGLPAWLRARLTATARGSTPGSALTSDSRPLLEQFPRSGFVVLGEVPDRELVVGAVGRFWRLAGGLALDVTGPQEFLAFDRPGYAKVCLNFLVEPRSGARAAGPSGAVRLRTETRIYTTDAAARHSFGRYWRLIFPGSALIRRMWLRAITRWAELAVQNHLK